jgi:acyl-CoA thioesterase-2
MGDLAEQTAVEDLGDGRFRGTLSQDWEIWGPMGGYVAAHALRAVGGSTPHALPVAFSCHYLGVARFDAIDIVVEPRKEGRAASSHRVAITQDSKPILDAMVWSAAGGEGLEHDETVPPDVPGPEDLMSISELVPPDVASPFKFWENLDAKPLAFEADWPPDGPRAARWQEWLQFRPTASWDDEWVDACRSVILVDLPSWPSAHRPHAWKQEPWMAPTLDLNIAFHRSARGEPWLLCDGSAPVSTGGLFGWTAKVWSTSRELLASGGGQCLYRRLPTG